MKSTVRHVYAVTLPVSLDEGGSGYNFTGNISGNSVPSLIIILHGLCMIINT